MVMKSFSCTATVPPVKVLPTPVTCRAGRADWPSMKALLRRSPDHVHRLEQLSASAFGGLRIVGRELRREPKAKVSITIG